MEYTTKLWFVEADIILDLVSDRIKDIESGQVSVENKQDDLETLNDIANKMRKIVHND